MDTLLWERERWLRPRLLETWLRALWEYTEAWFLALTVVCPLFIDIDLCDVMGVSLVEGCP